MRQRAQHAGSSFNPPIDHRSPVTRPPDSLVTRSLDQRLDPGFTMIELLVVRR